MAEFNEMKKRRKGISQRSPLVQIRSLEAEVNSSGGWPEQSGVPGVVRVWHEIVSSSQGVQTPARTLNVDTTEMYFQLCFSGSPIW